jgi:metal-sulfur cluster biosynthetic enzyme
MDMIRPVVDPEIGVSIVDLGLVYDVWIDEENKHIIVKMTLTSPGCPAGPEIMDAVDHAVRTHTGFEKVKVELVWEPKWDPREMASDEAKDILGIW